MNDRHIKKGQVPVISGKDLEELEEFLLSGAGLAHAMHLDELDGFLTAIVIGPVTVVPSTWLPHVWDLTGQGGAPEFQSSKQAEQIIGLLMQMMNTIIKQLEQFPDDYHPLPDVTEYENEREKLKAANSWCRGFMLGVNLTQLSWEDLILDEHDTISLSAISIVSGLLDADVKISDEMLRSFWKSVPQSVCAIRKFWLPYREREMAKLAESGLKIAGEQIGRNDPCSCGSGKKYKACCGR
jgi:uncharacterized protein